MGKHFHDGDLGALQPKKAVIQSVISLSWVIWLHDSVDKRVFGIDIRDDRSYNHNVYNKDMKKNEILEKTIGIMHLLILGCWQTS